MLRNQLNSNLVVLIVQCTFIAIQKINVHVFAKIVVGGPRGRKGCPGAVRTKEHHTTVGVDSRGASRSKNGPAPPPGAAVSKLHRRVWRGGAGKKIGSKISGEKEMGVKLRFVPPQATVRGGGGSLLETPLLAAEHFPERREPALLLAELVGLCVLGLEHGAQGVAGVEEHVGPLLGGDEHVP